MVNKVPLFGDVLPGTEAGGEVVDERPSSQQPVDYEVDYSKMTAEELETSDYLRSELFPSGWWLVPMAILNLIIIAGILAVAL